MDTINFHRFSGAAAIASAVLYVVSIIGMQYYLAVDLSDVGAFVENMALHHEMMLMYGWPGLIATLLILPMVQSLTMVNKSRKEYARIAQLVTTVGLVFVMVGYLFHLSLTYFHVPMYLEADSPTIYGAIIKTTVGLQDMFWLSGDLFAFLGIGLVVILAGIEDHLGRWLVMTGAVAGFLAAIGSFGFVPAFKPTGLGFVFIGGFSVFAIWEIIVGIKLLRRS